MTATPTFCPICGENLTAKEEGGRMRPACDNCGYVHYINPVPGVGLIIEVEGGVVLVQRGNPPHQGAWALPGGFVEADESVEEAAVREAEEETGLKIKLTELAGINSFPEGPPVSGVMIFYYASVIGGEMQAGDDATAVRVFQPQELPRLPFRTHREIISEWISSRVNHQHIPETSKDAKEFNIRLITPPDFDDVLGLLALIPSNRKLKDSEWGAIALRLQEATNVEVFVAQAVGASSIIMGCVVLSIARGLTEGIGIINDMAVLPTYQRRGVGAALLEAAMRRASQINLRSIWVNTQRANDQARAFYSRLGLSDLHLMHLKIR